MKKTKLDARSKKLRTKILDAFTSARRGHVGSALSIVEILRVLYDDILSYKASNPNWNKRDRFILSKGHGSLALYAILADKGFFPESVLKTFCKTDSMIGQHPDHSTPGVEMSTGSLGHGFPVGVGLAMNAKMKKLAYRTFVIVSDGESQEGSIWEAAMIAGKHHLDNLVVIVDYNRMQSYGAISLVQDLEPLAAKWEASGWAVAEVDGHNIADLRRILIKIPFLAGKPNLIIAHTVKGKGIKIVENNPSWHHKVRLTNEEVTSLYKALEEY